MRSSHDLRSGGLDGCVPVLVVGRRTGVGQSLAGRVGTREFVSDECVVL